ncbi:VOC family protein [Xylanibacillus composti]|uniref:Lactoylglutathione lyase n=1 Tax=Xylanibacillus composti TaxID=1572762 RepID=A0A8J4H0Q9_9BACL|nr:VOC family protein [Xylanibacillus composti]MDT9725125.1 VOC family protein [Xylanibacillus composti]GIQ67302.1 lactoylglutathione lyase [Xylanibacillus composti]
MSQNVLGTNVITQIGILVNDIEKTSQAYAEFFGVEKPKWFWTDTVDVAQTEYMGKPSEARSKLAFFDMGSLQLELIEPDQHPSTWRDHLNAHGEGPHHIAFVIEGMKEKIAVMEAKGMKLIQKGEYTGGRYAYMDTFPQLKVMLELLENDK